jgi:hypothetical protein
MTERRIRKKTNGDGSTMSFRFGKAALAGAAILIAGGYALAQTAPPNGPGMPGSMQHAMPSDSGTQQEHIHEMGQTVMPFDLNKTTHIFRMTDSGGTQSVVVKDSQDKDQIGLIRQHLRHEAEAFQRGDYTDPMALHGKMMPGVSELEKYHAAIAISYSDLPLGAALTFKTGNRHLVTAIHRWFGAQLSEHGADARPE